MLSTVAISSGGQIFLRKISETATTITLGWIPVPGAIGYRFQNSNGKTSHTWDGARKSVKFSKGSAWYSVEAIMPGSKGIYP